MLSNKKVCIYHIVIDKRELVSKNYLDVTHTIRNELVYMQIEPESSYEQRKQKLLLLPLSVEDCVLIIRKIKDAHMYGKINKNVINEF